jgi:hypothetical protein
VLRLPTPPLLATAAHTGTVGVVVGGGAACVARATVARRPGRAGLGAACTQRLDNEPTTTTTSQESRARLLRAIATVMIMTVAHRVDGSLKAWKIGIGSNINDTWSIQIYFGRVGVTQTRHWALV